MKDLAVPAVWHVLQTRGRPHPSTSSVKHHQAPTSTQVTGLLVTSQRKLVKRSRQVPGLAWTRPRPVHQTSGSGPFQSTAKESFKKKIKAKKKREKTRCACARFVASEDSPVLVFPCLARVLGGHGTTVYG